MAIKKTETKKTAPRKKKVEAVPVPEPVKELEVSYIYHTGDNINDIAAALTGHAYLAGALLSRNGRNLNTLTDGDMLKWSI